MSLFGIPKEQHQQLVEQLQAANSQLVLKEEQLVQARNALARNDTELMQAVKSGNTWKKIAQDDKQTVADAEKRATAAELERDRLREAIVSAAAADGWHSFGGRTYYNLDPVTKFRMGEVLSDPNDPTTKYIGVTEIDGTSLDARHYPTPEHFLALLTARKSGRRGGGSTSADDLPSAPIAPKPTQKPPQPGTNW